MVNQMTQTEEYPICNKCGSEPHDNSRCIQCGCPNDIIQGTVLFLGSDEEFQTLLEAMNEDDLKTYHGRPVIEDAT